MQFKGTLYLPGDKSISHRAIMLSSIANGKSIIRNLNDGDDLQSTISVLKACGAKIDRINKTIEVEGVEYPLVKLEISRTSHPFYTGKSKLVDTAGRIDKFKNKYAKFKKE